MKTVLVCGSRLWTDHVEIYLALDELRHEFDEPIRVVHGDCKGADRIAGKIADDFGWPVKPYPAEWKKYKGAAGPIRNREIWREEPDISLVIAVGSGHGTEDMVRLSTAAGVEVRRRGLPE